MTDHGRRLMKQDRGLVIHYRWSVHDNGRLMIDDWTAMNYERCPMYHDVWTMIDFWWRMVNYRRSFH